MEEDRKVCNVSIGSATTWELLERFVMLEFRHTTHSYTILTM